MLLSMKKKKPKMVQKGGARPTHGDAKGTAKQTGIFLEFEEK